ncbi:ABC transporter ATP-binding protein [Salipiger sp.]|uniref:ABC transporter ATP-binding protein n=1 Tax=Salipiger sp. TaxID=2078585 RepID=UPI003A97F378
MTYVMQSNSYRTEGPTVAATAQAARAHLTAPETDPNPKLKVEDAWITFGTKAAPFVACGGVEFEVADQEFIAIVGPSGCGKSTFLMALDGLQKLTSGRIEVNGTEVREPGRDRAVVFQDASLLPWRSVIDNVAYGLELAGQGKAQRYATARELIALAGLAGFEDFYPSKLSGGMRQRVNIARALAADPEVLLLDEPFSGLDAQTREVMQAELLKIWGERRKTAIFVTHQIDEAVFLADRVIAFGRRPAKVVQEWRIPFDRPRELSIKHSAEHRRIENEIWEVLQAEGAGSEE